MSQYTKINNKFTRFVKEDVREKLEVEIGDTKQSNFYPQVKLKKWDNEVNLSIRLKDSDYTSSSVVEEDGKIKWKSPKREVHFYDIDPIAGNPQLEEGGYELDVVLLEKPASNVLEFTIETKNTEFLYQSPLTQEQKDAICIGGDEPAYNQPENVTGSYAVYHNDTPNNFDDGKLYKVGKVAHIFRPKIIDSAGTWVWGELNIDVQKKLLTVTIPQDFLDNAVYPVRHAAGMMLGFSGVGAQTVTIEGIVKGSIWTSANPAGSVVSIHAYTTASATTRTYALSIYKSDLTLVASASTGELTPAADAAWRNFTYVSAPTLIDSTGYILAAFGSSSSGTHTVSFEHRY